MKKLSKNCNVQLIIKNTNVVADTNHLCSEVYGNFCGTKNEVISQLRKDLVKYNSFTGKLLTDTLDAINKTSRVYKSAGEGVYETVIHAFNPTTKKLYTFKVKYDVKRMSNLPSKHKINNMGENLYEKRLVQLYGGGNLGRYRLAIKNVNIYTLLELLSPMISVQFKNAASIRFSKENGFTIDYPRNFEFKPNDDLTISINLNNYWSTVYVDIIYKGRTVKLLNNRYEEITKESITEALKVADQFDEICNIVKNAYSL